MKRKALTVLLCVSFILSGCGTSGINEMQRASEQTEAFLKHEEYVEKDDKVENIIEEPNPATEQADDSLETRKISVYNANIEYLESEMGAEVEEHEGTIIASFYEETPAGEKVYDAAFCGTNCMGDADGFDSLRSVRNNLLFGALDKQFEEWENTDKYYVGTFYEYNQEMNISIKYYFLVPKTNNKDRNIYFLSLAYEPISVPSEYLYGRLADAMSELVGNNYMKTPSIYEEYDVTMENLKAVYQLGINPNSKARYDIPFYNARAVDEAEYLEDTKEFQENESEEIDIPEDIVDEEIDLNIEAEEDIKSEEE